MVSNTFEELSSFLKIYGKTTLAELNEWVQNAGRASFCNCQLKALFFSVQFLVKNAVSYRNLEFIVNAVTGFQSALCAQLRQNIESMTLSIQNVIYCAAWLISLWLNGGFALWIFPC